MTLHDFFREIAKFLLKLAGYAGMTAAIAFVLPLFAVGVFAGNLVRWLAAGYEEGR